MQATTIITLAKRAPLVLRVVVRESTTHGDRKRVRLELVEALRGSPPRDLTIEELHARHCGSCAHGLTRNARLLVFASARDQKLHVLGAARGLVHETPERLTLVRKLLDTQISKLAGTVVPLLTSSDERIASDAALALPSLPGVEALDNANKARMATALAAAEKAPDAKLYGLVLACARALPETAARSSWRLWLDADRRAWHGLASDVLLRECAPEITCASVEVARLSSTARARVARLLFDAPSAHATTKTLLRRLAVDGSREVRVEAISSLLMHSTSDEPGTPTNDAELRDARARLRTRQRARFGAIRPLNESRK